MGQGIIVLMSGSGGDGAMSILYDNSYNKFKYMFGNFLHTSRKYIIGA